MKRILTLLIISLLISCNNNIKETTEYIKLKKQYNELNTIIQSQSRTIDSLQNTPEHQFSSAKKMLSEGKRKLALNHFIKISKNFKDSEYEKKSKIEIEKIEKYYKKEKRKNDCKLLTVMLDGTEKTMTALSGPISFNKFISPLGNTKTYMILTLENSNLTSKHNLINKARIYFKNGEIIEFEEEIEVEDVLGDNRIVYKYSAWIELTPKLKRKLVRSPLRGFSLSKYEKAINNGNIYIDQLKCLNKS
jgi:hypothetical protein